MNPHRCALTWLIAVCCAVAPAAVCLGQDALPADVKAATDMTAYESQIQAFVQAHVQKLSNAEDPVAQSRSRDTLIRAVDDANASPAFLDTYARLLNTALLEAAGNENMRVRLNGAIVAARVAERANNSRLAPAASQFLQDQATPVVMWGMTTAKSVMPAIMRDPLQRANHPLPAALVPALKNHPAGPVVQDTYDALGLGIFQDVRTVPPGIDGAIPLMLDLIAYRVDLYTQGTPEEPWADQKAGLFFQNRGVWQALKAEQRVQAMQAMSNLISVVAQQTRNASAGDREQLIDLVRQLAQSIEVIANDHLQHQGLRQAAQLVKNIDKNTPPAEVVQRVERLYPQIIQISEFQGVQGPPVVGAARPQAASANDGSVTSEAGDEPADVEGDAAE